MPVATLATGEATAGKGIDIRICQERYQGSILAINAQGALNAAHILSAGAVSFARGLNDTPKIVALLVTAQALAVRSASVIVGLAMAAGAILHARKIAEAMGWNITEMNHGQGFTANFVTAGLVTAASGFGFPVSTTHISCGSLFGLGATTGRAHWKAIGEILLAWVVTLPVSAAFAAAAAAVS